MKSQNSWQEIGQRKRALRDGLIPKEWRLPSTPSSEVTNVLHIPRTCGLLNEEELDITENHDATSLAQCVSSREFSSEAVTIAYCKRAAIAHQLTNCLTEIMFEAAIQRARYLDHYLKTHKKPMGPLHGVPISLKDMVKVAGVDASIGIAALAFKPSLTSAPIVSILLSQGAVIYCKTNIPQTLMALDSENNLFGRTLNPLNRRLTAGGSSGGEGVLIAMKASALGVGTDIGGSIRIPAMCNGVYGIKPSAHRIPLAEFEAGNLPGTGALGVHGSAGPIARSLRDCELFLRCVAEGRPWELDPLAIPGNWDSMDAGEQSKVMSIGIMRTDHLIKPLPPILALLNEVSERLADTGIRVVDINPPAAFGELQNLANGLFSIDGGNHMLDILDQCGEPLSTWLSTRLKRKEVKTTSQTRDLQARREQMMNQMLSLWRAPDGSQIDALICPVAPHPVPELDTWNGVSYTSSWVVLDCPAGTIPVRRFEKQDLVGETDTSAPLSSWDAANRKLWNQDRKVYLGSPMCIQVVAPRLQEKRLYGAMKAIDDILNGSKEKSSDFRSKL